MYFKCCYRCWEVPSRHPEPERASRKIKVQWGTGTLIVPVLDLYTLSSIGKWIPFWHPPTTLHHPMAGLRTAPALSPRLCDPAHTPEREAVSYRTDGRVGQYAAQSLAGKSLVGFKISTVVFILEDAHQPKEAWG